jgi:hypothetical protein
MAYAIQRRRGTTAQHETFTGLNGEITVDTTKKTVVVHDGSTLGGFPLAKESQVASVANDLQDHIDDDEAHDASAIVVTPSGNLSATTVQDALAELDSEKAKASDLSDVSDVVNDLVGATSTLGTTKLDKAGGTITGNIDFSAVSWNFTGTAARIKGKFSGSWSSDNTMFQSNVLDGMTIIGALPNGTGTAAGFLSYNASDITDASFLISYVTNVAAHIMSGKLGDGLYLPLTFYTGGVERVRITPNGDTRGHYTNGATIAAGNTLNYNPATHGQVFSLTLTGAGTVTFGAPTNITEGAFYTLLLKADDTDLRSFAWNAAYKFPGAISPLDVGTANAGAYDSITFVGGPGNTLIYQGHQADLR